MSTASELRDYIEQIPFFDTHSHAAGFDTGTPLDDKQGKSLPALIMNDYLSYLAGSCADVPIPPQKNGGWTLESAPTYFEGLLPVLDQYRALTTWKVLREGIRELFPFKEEDITEANWHHLNEQIVAAYQEYGEREWYRMAIRRANVIRQNQMATLPYVTDHWDTLPPDERQQQKAFLLPSLILDGYLFSGFASGKPGRERSKELLNCEPKTHAEYLDFMGRVLDLFKSRGGASVKLLINYHRTLFFDSEVTDTEAASLFAKHPDNPAPPRLTPGEFQRLQDNLCWHMLEMARDRGLPLIVHCGYSWPTHWGDPENMHNLFKNPRVRGLNVDLCHSGWPHHGGGMIMARSYRTCYFNLCWTPMLSADLGRQILSQCIDMLPKNKILTGTDCGSAESMLGTVRHLRSELGAVLLEKVERGYFGLDVAKKTARAILLDNPLEFYAMKYDDIGLREEESMLTSAGQISNVNP